MYLGTLSLFVIVVVAIVVRRCAAGERGQHVGGAWRSVAAVGCRGCTQCRWSVRLGFVQYPEALKYYRLAVAVLSSLQAHFDATEHYSALTGRVRFSTAGALLRRPF